MFGAPQIWLSTKASYGCTKLQKHTISVQYLWPILADNTLYAFKHDGCEVRWLIDKVDGLKFQLFEFVAHAIFLSAVWILKVDQKRQTLCCLLHTMMVHKQSKRYCTGNFILEIGYPWSNILFEYWLCLRRPGYLRQKPEISFWLNRRNSSLSFGVDADKPFIEGELKFPISLAGWTNNKKDSH